MPTQGHKLARDLSIRNKRPSDDKSTKGSKDSDRDTIASRKEPSASSKKPAKSTAAVEEEPRQQAPRGEKNTKDPKKASTAASKKDQEQSSGDKGLKDAKEKDAEALPDPPPAAPSPLGSDDGSYNSKEPVSPISEEDPLGEACRAHLEATQGPLQDPSDSDIKAAVEALRRERLKFVPLLGEHRMQNGHWTKRRHRRSSHSKGHNDDREEREKDRPEDNRVISSPKKERHKLEGDGYWYRPSHRKSSHSQSYDEERGKDGLEDRGEPSSPKKDRHKSKQSDVSKWRRNLSDYMRYT